MASLLFISSLLLPLLLVSFDSLLSSCLPWVNPLNSFSFLFYLLFLSGLSRVCWIGVYVSKNWACPLCFYLSGYFLFHFISCLIFVFVFFCFVLFLFICFVLFLFICFVLFFTTISLTIISLTFISFTFPQFLGATCLVFMTTSKVGWLVSGIYVFRTAFMRFAPPFLRPSLPPPLPHPSFRSPLALVSSILMDVVPKANRGKWNSVERYGCYYYCWTRSLLFFY